MIATSEPEQHAAIAAAAAAAASSQTWGGVLCGLLALCEEAALEEGHRVVGSWLPCRLNLKPEKCENSGRVEGAGGGRAALGVCLSWLALLLGVGDVCAQARVLEGVEVL